MAKTTKAVEVFDGEVYAVIPTNCNDFMRFWQEKIDLIPDEFRNDAEINLEPEKYYNGPGINLSVSYRRLETDEEEAKRNAIENQQLEDFEKAEMIVYKRLKAKYEEYENGVSK